MRRSGGRPHRRSSARRLSTLIVGLVLATIGLAGGAGPGTRPTDVAAAGKDEVSILSGPVASLDPALQGDIASARVGAQLFETLTAIDPSLNVRPALAESWDVLDGGRRVVFHLRPGQAFSDGSPLGAKDVVRSWLRIVDPKRPSPLASLMADVEGALDYLRGKTRDPSTVGIRADGATIEVRLNRPAADFPSIVSSATFAVVPPGVGSKTDALAPGSHFVASGAYVLSAENATEMTLTANDRYWAGPPPIHTVHLLITLKGKSPVQAFEDGQLDYTPIGDYDAAWIRYDATLGRALRSVPSAAVSYYGFDASRPPFDDVKVRQAFAWAVDWKRIVNLSGGVSQVPATSLVPPGIPGRSERDFSPKHDPAAARASLAAAGYPGGAGFPEVTLVDSGAGYDEAILAELKRELGITVRYEGMESGTVLQPAGGRSAGLLGAGLGGRLPRTERLPWSPARDWELQRLWTLELGRVRRGDRPGRRGDRSGLDPGSLRYGRVDRPARRAGRAGVLWRRVCAGSGWPARGDRDRPRDPAPGRSGLGHQMTRGRDLRRTAAILAAALLLSGRRAGDRQPAGRGRRPGLRDADGHGEVRRRGDLQPAVHTVPRDPPGRDPDQRAGLDRAAGGGGAAAGLLRPGHPAHTLAEADGHLVPNTRFSARWRVTSQDGSKIVGDEASVVYADTRFDWKTVSGPIVRVHWYQGTLDFGKRALAIGEGASTTPRPSSG